MYTYDDATDAWEQKGVGIDGEDRFFFSCESISLSANGNTVAIGHFGGVETDYYDGFVRNMILILTSSNFFTWR